MYRLTIVNAAGEEVKTYQPDGVYVMKAEKTENTLLLTRAANIITSTAPESSRNPPGSANIT